MRNEIICGDVMEVLKTLPDNLVDCVVTSPPYWGLRDYGIDGQIGLEPTIGGYIAQLTVVFREVRRVLKPEGTLWLNMGDGYYGGGKAGKNGIQIWGGIESGNQVRKYGPPMKIPSDAKPKDLIGQPWRLAFALQADGWYLRRDIIWAKPNPMPESAKDRPTKSHEYLFLLTKQPRYYYDAEAIREESTYAGKEITLGEKSLSRGQAAGANVKPSGNGKAASVTVTPCRNKRDVWNIDNSLVDFLCFCITKGIDIETLISEYNDKEKLDFWCIATQAFPEAHFATFPEALVEPCILAGTSQKGYCPGCGKPWTRVVEKTPGVSKECPKTQAAYEARGGNGKATGTVGKSGGGRTDGIIQTIGWKPSCECYVEVGTYTTVLRKAETPDTPVNIIKTTIGETIPGLVLDPFMGSGTVALVAKKLSRDYLGIELNPEYIKIAQRRLYAELALFL